MDETQDVDWGDNPQDGIVNEHNLNQYLADDIEDGTGDTLYENTESEPDYRQEIPLGNQRLGIPEDTQEVNYADGKSLAYDGIDNSEIISFEYTNRHGDYAGLRTVEPHYAFIARTTGNEILVCFDLDVNEIRAFILGNIHPNGVRYKGVKFQPRSEIMRGVA